MRNRKNLWELQKNVLRIRKILWEIVEVYENQEDFVKIRKNLWKLERICENKEEFVGCWELVCNNLDI